MPLFESGLRARRCPGESDTTSGALQRLASSGAALARAATTRDADAFWGLAAGLAEAVENADAEVNYVLDDGDLKTTARAYLAAAARALA